MKQGYALGVDVGGTKIEAVLVDDSGAIISRYSTEAHSEREPEVVLDYMQEACEQVIATSEVSRERVVGIGVGFAGNVNGPAGIVLISSNLPAWDHYPLRDNFAERMGLPVLLDNDANMGALAEHRYGAGRGTINMCYVTYSTGYGAGIIANGKLYVGNTGNAGEVGHVVITPHDGPPCSCGKKGCIMAYASGVGISRMLYDAIDAGEETVLREQIPEGRRRFHGAVVAQAAADGDAVAKRVLDTSGYYAGIGLSVLIEVLNPELIVLGGGLLQIGDPVRRPMFEAMYEHTQPELHDSVDVVPGQMSGDITVLGAAAKVFGELGKS
jgi:glucokinase